MRAILLLFLITAAGLLRAELPASVMQHAEVTNLLSKSCLRIDASGCAEAAFSDLLTVSRRGDLLTAVQQEYAAMLPEGEKPEFTVEEISPGEYFYVNRNRQESHVSELLREVQPDGMLHAVYLISGERFFGRFQALVHVSIADAGAGRVEYFAEVYAHPENRFCRWLAHGLHAAIESFFRRETRCMTGLVMEVCSRLVTRTCLASASL